MKNSIIFLCFLYMVFCMVTGADSTDYDLHGRIESLRKGDIITILFEKKPAMLKAPEPGLEKATIKIPASNSDYYIMDGDNKVIGSVRLITASFSADLHGKTRVVASFSLKKKSYRPQLRAGNPIVLTAVKKLPEEASVFYGTEKIKHKEQIVGPIDGRIMVLVPGGKFLFGTNTADRDEYPEQVVSLDDFYIDKYEVSNRDYAKFISATKSKRPLSWKKGRFLPEEGDLPVLVTFYEAKAYASWAGKRLPTEQEWEKAARGAGSVPGGYDKTLIYPWGNAFDPDRVNSIEFWSKSVIGMKIKDSFTITQKGFLPVYFFEDSGISPCGAVNMSGNAKEWTDSWYMPYKGNHFKNRKFGTQYKVVRGGAWYNDRTGVRATVREPGGIPNLHKDNLAGFRCVIDPSILDMD